MINVNRIELHNMTITFLHAFPSHSCSLVPNYPVSSTCPFLNSQRFLPLPSCLSTGQCVYWKRNLSKLNTNIFELNITLKFTPLTSFNGIYIHMILFSGAKHHIFVLTYVIFLALVCQPDRPTNKTSAPIGAWKCNFPPFYHRPTDQPTKQTEIGVHREVTLPIICWCRFAPRKFLLPDLFSFPPHPSIKIWSSRIFNIQPFWFATLVPAFDSFDGIP